MTGVGGSIAEKSTAVDGAVRIGLVAYGVVHLLIAWVALQLALGDHSEEASKQGALRTLADEPFGGVLLWAITLGMVCLILWRVLEAATDDDGRLAHLGKAVVYAAVGVSAFKVATGDSGGSDAKSQRTLTATLMDHTAGTWLVGLIGLAIIGYGLWQVRRGFTEKYREHLSSEGRRGEAGTAYLLFGKIGYVAKGIVIGLVGVLFLYAAIDHDPRRSGGLDEALRTVLQQPFGPVLLAAIALGIGCYGLFCFARARHLAR